MQNKLPERLKKLRADTELSQAKLAAILGIPQQTYNNWEQSNSQPDIEMLMRLALYFDVTLDYLTGLSNDIIATNETVATINSGINNGSINGSININQKNKK